MASFKSSARSKKRLVNLAFGVFGLLIIMLAAAIFAGWRTQTVQADSADKPIFKPHNKRPINLGLKNSEPSEPPVKQNKNLSRRLATQQSVQGRKQPFVGAVNGEAFLLEEKGKRGVKTNALKTTLPVFKAFGLSSNNGKLLYTSLKNGVPSGELYLEDLATGERVRVTTEVVMTAAFSPVNDNQIAYTFADGGGFALAVADLDAGRHSVIVAENVYTEIIEWDNSGKGIHYYETAVQERNLNLSLKYAQTDSSLAGKDVLPATPAGFPVLEKSDNFQALIEGGTLGGEYAFSGIAPDGLHEIAGSNLLGVSRLFAYNSLSGRTITLGEGQLVETLPTGILFKEFSKKGTRLQFADWQGNTTPIGLIAVNYKLPVQNSLMTQGGTGYSVPGNCSITAHAGALEFAYDFQSVVSAHVLASADGLVVFNTSSMTCNTIDTESCPDYNPNGCPGTFLGNVVIIQHSDGTYTKYAHLETNSPQVEVGTSINQGLYIARQGHTGSTNGTFNGCGDHIHFQRQSSPDIFGQSIEVDFDDVEKEPLSCGLSYTSGNTEISHSISPSSQNFGISGGSGSVNVTSTGGTWFAVSRNNWITVTSAGSGTGNGIVTYTVSDNSTSGQRTGTINIGGHLFTVSQSGGGVNNQAPTVNAGNDQTVTLPAAANLSGTATDDGLPNPPGAVTTTWSKVSGPGTVGFGDVNSLNTTASFSAAGIYILRLTAADGALTVNDDVRVVVNTNSGGGALTVSQASPPGNINLTTEGTADWAHWGLNSPSDFNRKSSVTPQITSFTQIGNITPLRYTNNSSSFNWNDGTPTTGVGGTTTGVYVYEVGNGFQFVLPADTTPRTLKLYVGLWAAGGRFEATLSDGSASPYIDTSLISTGVLNSVYTLNYRAATSGQTLTVRWIVNSNSNALGNITLQAATLTGSGSQTNQAPVVNAGNDQTVTLPAAANLSGTATDDGLPNPPGAVTTTWSKVSGPGTVGFGDVNSLNTTASFSAAGIYILRLTAADGALTVNDDIAITVNGAGGGTGMISASSADTSATVSLTTEGTADWAHWGLNSPNEFNHKIGVTQQISNLTVLGGEPLLRFTNNTTSYSWSDGTPVASENGTIAGVYVLGANNGFQINVPAETFQRTLKVYVGLYAAGGKFEASLSDNSAPVYVDTSLVNASGVSNRTYTLNYRAAAAGQTLTVKWTANTTFNMWSNVTFQAAALVNGTTFAPPPLSKSSIFYAAQRVEYFSPHSLKPNNSLLPTCRTAKLFQMFHCYKDWNDGTL